jgi:Zn-finger nucleic acid-binding protein
MIYPVCNTQLLRSEKQGTGIDFCAKCDRLWLERDITENTIERQAFIGIQNYHTDSRNDGNDGQNYGCYKPNDKQRKPGLRPICLFLVDKKCMLLAFE